MKQVKSFVLALALASGPVFAKDSSLVGFCSGYLLMTDRTARALEVIKQADNLAEAQAAARFIVKIAKMNPV